MLFGGVDAKELLGKHVENLLKAGGASLCFILFHHSSVLNCAFIIVDQVWVLEYIAPEV